MSSYFSQPYQISLIYFNSLQGSKFIGIRSGERAGEDVGHHLRTIHRLGFTLHQKICNKSNIQGQITWSSRIMNYCMGITLCPHINKNSKGLRSLLDVKSSKDRPQCSTTVRFWLTLRRSFFSKISHMFKLMWTIWRTRSYKTCSVSYFYLVQLINIYWNRQ